MSTVFFLIIMGCLATVAGWFVINEQSEQQDAGLGLLALRPDEAGNGASYSMVDAPMPLQAPAARQSRYRVKDGARYQMRAR